ncbi:helix-hairpin-helix domain-containing protein [Labilibaculum sp.]|uniref:helix-hairpin-helix domain-containing protein n=1 Tax=Labilibaculum sp. TaxID=2060723 RepID=UPI003565CBCD
MNFKQLFREYFSYSASEKKGLLVLVILLLILYFLPIAFHNKTRIDSFADSAKQNSLDSLVAVLLAREDTKQSYSVVVELKMFNPNTCSKDELLKLGFTPYQANNLIKYRSKGGRFEKKTDLLKLYGFDQSDLERLNAYIQIPVVSQKKEALDDRKNTIYELYFFDPNEISLNDWVNLGVSRRIGNRIKNYIEAGGRFSKASDLQKIYGFDSDKYKELLPYVQIAESEKKTETFRKQVILLNAADTSQLKQLRGIGSVLSKRIVKYRNVLGGFVSKDQLMEVYGISREEFELISPMITVDSINVRKLALNSFTADKFRKHPYLNSRTSNNIVRFRKRNGNFNSIDQLLSHKIVPDSIFTKLRPYLELK